MELSEEEAGRLLDVHVDTIRRWVRQGLLTPADANGHRFTRAELERWARARGFHLGARGRARWEPIDDLFAEAVRRGALTGDAECASAAEAIETAVLAVPDLSGEIRTTLLQEVREREGMASTALGHGVALPHPRKPRGDLFSEPIVSVVFPREPLDWAALDGEPVHTVLLLLSPSAPVHLEILSRVAHALRTPGFTGFLRGRPSRDALVDRLRTIPREG